MGKEAETTREFRWPGAGHCGPGGGQRIDRGPSLDMARGYLTTDYTDGGWAPSPDSKTVGSHLSKFTFFGGSGFQGLAVQLKLPSSHCPTSAECSSGGVRHHTQYRVHLELDQDKAALSNG